MKEQYKKKLSSAEQRLQIDEIVSQCNAVVFKYLENWQPFNAAWDTVEGCTYLRLSDPSQVLVEKGSLEQQTNIAIAEAKIRSEQDRINYKITYFYIEPGITGRHDKRPQFQAMTKAIIAKKHAFVLFKEVARISRMVLIWKEFFQICIKAECQVMIRGFPFNPNDPSSTLQMDILAVFSEFESNQTSKRLKESSFSAMVSSGKFNSTKKFLGFDQLEENGTRKVGLYSINEEEKKIVIKIFEIFLECGSYQGTLHACSEQGITNKNGKPFTKQSLLFLLRNKRYIGKWEINTRNRDKPSNKLMPYERHEEISLPLTPLLSQNTWDETQIKIAKLRKSRHKDHNLTRVYLLSGLLKASDGTRFHGSSGKGKTKNFWYYYHPQTRTRVMTDAVEEEAKKIVSQIIRDSKELRSAIERYAKQVDDSITFLDAQERTLKDALGVLQNKLEALNTRLDFLINGDPHSSSAHQFRATYFKDSKEIEDKKVAIQSKLQNLANQKIALKSALKTDKNDLLERAHTVQKLMEEQNPLALKNAYSKLFERVVVTRDEIKGIITLDFILFDWVPPNDTHNVASCVGVRLVGDERLELPTLTV